MSRTREFHSKAGETSRLSIVDGILQIGRHHIPNHKSKIWFESLICLWTDTNDPKKLHIERGIPDGDKEDNFIAVSYPFEHTPGLECDCSGAYTIVGPSGKDERRSEVRNEILDGVLKYAKHQGGRRFWIDRECSPQVDGSMEKQLTMDCMDLLYLRSAHPLGLLSVKLEDQSEVDHLQQLMMGDMVIQTRKDEYPRLSSPASSSSPAGVLKVLVHLHKDRWWTRAWIFREEYLASKSMRILIRRNSGLNVRRRFGFLQDEMCLNAVAFRKQATLFLLAFKRKSTRELAKKCSKMLKRFGRYEIQYCFQHDAMRKAMSPRIFADIQRRRLRDCFDQLPIVANSCSYALRFVSKKMLESKYSLRLCLLTMYLLNGEILRDSRQIRKSPREMDISNYMQYISFNKFDPPVGGKHLSYLKACRFHEVSLARIGLVTKGHLWKVTGNLPMSKGPRCPRRSRKRHEYGLNDFQREHLFQLAETLQDSENNILAERVREYLEADMTYPGPKAVKRYVDSMAGVVVDAMVAGENLQVVVTGGSKIACGVVVGAEGIGEAIFTSWHARTGADGRFRESHVSLGVRVQDTGYLPLLDTVRWINGLFFFKQCDKIPVMFGWPRVCGWKAYVNS